MLETFSRYVAFLTHSKIIIDFESDIFPSVSQLEARTAFAENYSTSSDGSAIAKAVAIRRKNADRTAMRLALEVKENTSTHIVGGTRRRSGIIY